MTIQEYIQSIQESSISESIKLEIVSILESVSELDAETKEKVASLIEKDIDLMLEEDLDDEAKTELEAVDAQLDADLSDVEKEIEAGLLEVENELEEIDKLTTELNAIDEEVKITELKDTLASQE